MDIKIEQLSHVYQQGSPFERIALQNINLEIKSGEYVAIIGHTGSGKSTLIQHLNGLLKPTSGTVQIGSTVISKKTKSKQLYDIRKNIGMVFQYPEHQLFEETIEKDICYGPLNFGASLNEVKAQLPHILKQVGLDESFLQRSPFDLSGGQMRRVAIAGVLAMEPRIIVLDEPTAGLDPKGQQEMMDMFYQLHKKRDLTTVLVTHNMEDAAKYADRIIVMHQGAVHIEGKPKEIFKQKEKLQEAGIVVPATIRFMERFCHQFGLPVEDYPLTIDELTDVICSLWQERNGASCKS